MENEFVVWGCNKGEHVEQLLLALFNGKRITDKETAERLEVVLQNKFGCHSTRIQTVCLVDNKLGFERAIK